MSSSFAFQGILALSLTPVCFFEPHVIVHQLGKRYWAITVDVHPGVKQIWQRANKRKESSVGVVNQRFVHFMSGRKRPFAMADHIGMTEMMVGGKIY